MAGVLRSAAMVFDAAIARSMAPGEVRRGRREPAGVFTFSTKLSVTDPSAVATGRLVNTNGGTFSLPQLLQVRANNAGNTGTTYLPLSSTAGTPVDLLTYTSPTAGADNVTLHFRQAIGRQVRVKTESGRARGTVLSAGPTAVQIENGAAPADIPYDSIVRANLIDEGN